jgi:hypothetical protein
VIQAQGEQVDRGVAHSDRIDVHGGEGRVSKGGDVRVVVTDDRDVFGDAFPEILDGFDGSAPNIVIDRKSVV